MSTDMNDILGIIFTKTQTNVDKNNKNIQKEVRHEGITNVEKCVDIPYKKKKCPVISASSSSSSDSNSSDSDVSNKSSENEEENEREMEKCTIRMEDITIDFKILTEILQNEKSREIEEKIVEIKSGRAKEIREPLRKFREYRNTRLDIADSLRNFKLESIMHKFNAEDQSINQSFDNDKDILYDSIEDNLKAQIQELNDARNEVDIDAALWIGRSLTRSGRGRGRHPYGVHQPKNKPVITSGPCIVYMLKEEEILEDWAEIKKMTLTSDRIENKNKRTE